MTSASFVSTAPADDAERSPPTPASEFHDLAALEPCTQWKTLADGTRQASSQLVVTGLYCAACAGLIEQALKALPGVAGAQVNAASERLQVQWNPAELSASDLIDAVERAGYGAAPDAAAPAQQLRAREHRKALWRLFVAWFLMMQVMMLAAPAYFAEPGELPVDQLRLLQWGSWVLTVPVMLFAAGPFFQSAWRQLRQRRMGMDVPVALGLLVSFVASTGATFEPGAWFGHEVYFDSVTMFVAFLLAGRYLELRARHRVAASLETAMTQLPELVERIEPDGSSAMVPVARLRVGDAVRVCAGQGFPADGQISQGQTEVDEALLTGESRPVPKLLGDSVVAGSINLQAPVRVQVLRVGGDTRFEAIKALMHSALTCRPTSTRLTDWVAAGFLWGVLLLAALGAFVWSFIDPSRVVWVAVSVLIVTCPCALALAAPSAFLAATGALARRGVLLQRLEVLETLAAVDHVVLDKTGTLTEDRLSFLRSVAAEGTPVEQAQAWLLQAAALAQTSRHPLSRALALAVKADDHTQWTQVQELPGCGLQASDAHGQVWRLGRPGWVTSGATSVKAEAVLNAPEGLDDSQLAFGSAGRIALRLHFEETLRPDALPAVQRLRDMGLGVTLLSGDSPARVADVARKAGIDDARGGASPEAKLAVVADLQAQGRKVLMVGDGINDAPVLARADASFAMGQGALLAKAHADAFLLSERLMDIADARELALRTRRVMRQNLRWAITYNAACIPLALLGYLPPWAAGLGMAGSSLWVVSNSLRLARGANGQGLSA